MAWAYPWHMVLFHDKYKVWGAVTREHPIMIYGIIAIIIQGLVIGYLYPKLIANTQSTIKLGIKYNLIIGLMTYTAMGFATAAKINIEPSTTFLAYHTVFQFIQFCLTGVALGLIYKEN